VDLTRLSQRSDVEARLSRALPDAALRTFLLMGLESNAGKLAWRFNLGAIDAHYDDIMGPVADGCFEGPTLFLKGERSNHLREGDRPAVERRFPSARFLTIAAAGHWLHVDALDATLAAVREFASGAADRRPSDMHREGVTRGHGV
jgi:esterase